MLIAQRPTLTEEPIEENRSRFVLEPLEPGFGYTIGNSLRRTLLSSIPGASVTSIKVDSICAERSLAYRSRTIARANTGPEHAPSAWTTRQHVI